MTGRYEISRGPSSMGVGGMTGYKRQCYHMHSSEVRVMVRRCTGTNSRAAGDSNDENDVDYPSEQTIIRSGSE